MNSAYYSYIKQIFHNIQSNMNLTTSEDTLDTNSIIINTQFKIIVAGTY